MLSIEWREWKGGRISEREAQATAEMIARSARGTLEGRGKTKPEPLALIVNGDTLIVGVKGMAADAIDLYECRIVRHGEAVERESMNSRAARIQREGVVEKARGFITPEEFEEAGAQAYRVPETPAPPASVPGTPGYRKPTEAPAPAPRPRVAPTPMPREEHEQGCARCGHGPGWHRPGCEACEGVRQVCAEFINPTKATPVVPPPAKVVANEAVLVAIKSPSDARARLAALKLVLEDVQPGPMRAVVCELVEALDDLFAARESRP